MIKTRKKKVNKADLKNTNAGKYLTARHKKGMNKSQAAQEIGIDPRNVPQLEKTEVYQALEKKYFKDDLTDVISMRQIAEKLADNIMQDKDKGASNAAIKIALDKLEPDRVSDNAENERVFVIIK